MIRIESAPQPAPRPAAPAAAPAGDFVLGLDLGQTSDPSAVVVLQRGWALNPNTRRQEPHFTARHLHRWELLTSYPRIVEDVGALVCRPPLAAPLLAVDQTGVGRPVVDLFRQAGLRAQLVPILITAGHRAEKAPDGSWHVPKRELVGTLQALLQSRRLQIGNVPGRGVLVQELTAFRVKITTTGAETFEAWRERDHDDLVLAVAMACWLGSRPRPGQPVAGGTRYIAAAPRPGWGPLPGAGYDPSLD